MTQTSRVYMIPSIVAPVHNVDIDFETKFIGTRYDIAAKEISSMVLMKRHETNEAYLNSASKKKSNAVEIESLREKYHQRVSTLVGKIYEERDTLRRELNKKVMMFCSFKGNGKIINQVMATGEELHRSRLLKKLKSENLKRKKKQV
ncbi:hypothetical protein V6N11_028578 [Hibiscus sabdariffa]|uniref:Uncharacterized protein n=1 Tax=Hibiscus sabdariffa TaxID=183260 RepID=A0ABR2NA19_9ROSI